VIHLIAKKPVGILHLLDDESNFPKATDISFLEKCHYNHALNELYSRPRMSSMEFGVRHYAGQVWYNVEGFLDKNRDTLRQDVVDLLVSSKLPVSMLNFKFQTGFDANWGFWHTDGEQNVPVAAQLPGVFEDSEQGQRPLRHHEAEDADGGRQVPRLTPATPRFHVQVRILFSNPVKRCM
jgi:Myosin head (motor domain)